MRNLKKVVLSMLLVVAVLATSLTAFAASPTGKEIKSATLSKTSYVYTNQAKKPAVKNVKDADGNVLKEGTDYTVSYSHNIKCGTATVTITGKGAYAGSTLKKTFKITRAQAYAFVNMKTKVTVKASKSKAKTAGTIKFYLKQGSKYGRSYSKVTGTYTLTAKAKKAISVSKSGKITIKKGAKAGTYKITVKTKKVGNNYKAGTRTITIVVK